MKLKKSKINHDKKGCQFKIYNIWPSDDKKTDKNLVTDGKQFC